METKVQNDMETGFNTGSLFRVYIPIYGIIMKYDRFSTSRAST